MKIPLKVAAVALVVLAGCYMLLPGASEAGQPGEYKTAYGVAVYLGVKPAREIKARLCHINFAAENLGGTDL